MIPLFEAYPRLQNSLPFISLGEFPTPVDHLENLGKKIRTPNLYIKRDDLSGVDYGGNKVRKLEFLLAEAIQKNAKEILTFGFAGSNHALATGVYAKKVGLHSTSILLSQPNARYVRRNLLLSYVNDIELHHFQSVPHCVLAIVGKMMQSFGRNKKLPHIIPPGGSNPLGAVGFVNAAFELKNQIEEGLIPEPDEIYVALGTMGTAVGLMIGVQTAGLKSRIIPVRVVDRSNASEKGLAKLYCSTAGLLHRLDPSFPLLAITPQEITIEHQYFGEQYAKFTGKGMAAVQVVQETEGISLEGTYTGKTFSALLDHASTQNFGQKTILFWDTYNSRDFSSKIQDIDYHLLPKEFHGYFESDFQPLDVNH